MRLTRPCRRAKPGGTGRVEPRVGVQPRKSTPRARLGPSLATTLEVRPAALVSERDDANFPWVWLGRLIVYGKRRSGKRRVVPR